MSKISFRSASRQISYSLSANVSDTTDLTDGLTRALLVGTEGNVAVTYHNGVEDTIYLASGAWHPMSVKRVRETGTTALNIKAGY